MRWLQPTLRTRRQLVPQAAWIPVPRRSTSTTAASVTSGFSRQMYPGLFSYTELHDGSNSAEKLWGRHQLSSLSQHHLTPCSLHPVEINVRDMDFDEVMTVRSGDGYDCKVSPPPPSMRIGALGLRETMWKALVARTMLSTVQGSAQVRTTLNSRNYYKSTYDAGVLIVDMLYRDAAKLYPCPFASQLVQLHYAVLSSYHRSSGRMPCKFGYGSVINEDMSAVIRAIYQANAVSAASEVVESSWRHMLLETGMGKTMTRGLEAIFGKQSTSEEKNWHIGKIELKDGNPTTGKFFTVTFDIIDDVFSEKRREFSRPCQLYCKHNDSATPSVRPNR